MSADPGALPGIRRPVSGASVLAPADPVRYTEVDGLGVVCRIDTRAVNLLSPAGAALFARFDGRTPLAALDPDAAVIELARRLRAIGVLVDADPSAAPTAGAHATVGAARTELSMHGAAHASERGGVSVALAVASTDDQPAAPTVVITIGADAIRSGDEVVDGFVAPGGEGSSPLAPIEAFEHLIDCAASDELDSGLDALAELAERVPMVGAPRAGASGAPSRPSP